MQDTVGTVAVRTCPLTRTTAINILFDILFDFWLEVLPCDKVLAFCQCKVPCERIIVIYTYDLRSQRRIFWNYKGFTLVE
jgi:hypothetical protein